MNKRTPPHQFSSARYHLWLRTLIGAVLFQPAAVQAQTYATPTVTATQNVECAGSAVRTASALGCTAGEFVVSTSFDTGPGTPPFCTVGQSFTADVRLVLSGSNTNRYNIAFFTGENGNDPRNATTKAQGASCSAAVMPVSFTDPSQNPSNSLFYAADANSCGDLPKTEGVNQPVLIKGMKVACVAGTSTSDTLGVPYVLTYQQNLAGADCTVYNVQNGTTSKCNAGTATLNVNTQPIRVAGYVDVTKATTPGGDPTPFTFTATGAAGSYVGASVNGGAITSSNTNRTSFTLRDGQTARVYMSVLPTTRTLTITEDATPGWDSSADITCTSQVGTPTTTVNAASRQITTALSATNAGVKCTVTNSKRSRITLRKNVGGRVAAGDQFTVSATGGGTLTNATDTATVTPAASTTGTGTTASVTFYSTPGQALTLKDSVTAGQTPLSAYDARITCTNVRTGAATALPTNETLPGGQYVLTPQAGDDLTCTITNTPKPRITLNKVIDPNNGGRVSPTDQFTLAVGPATATTQGTGTTITAGGSVTATGTHNAAITLAETAAGTTNLNYYLSSISCTNSVQGSPTVLPSGAGRTFTITPRNNDVISCTLTNTNNMATLTATKTASSRFVRYGLVAPATVFSPTPRTLSYAVTITGTGATASNTMVSDTLPEGVANVSVRASDGNPVTLTDANGVPLSNPVANPPQVIRWTAGTLASGQAAAFTVTLSLPDIGTTVSATGPEPTAVIPAIQNTVTANADNAPAATSPVAVTDTVLTILKKTVQNLGPSAKQTSAPAARVDATPGDILRYCITATNWGTAVLNNYTISDPVPGNSVYIPETATLSPAGTATFNAGMITGRVGTLTSGGVATLCFNTRVN